MAFIRAFTGSFKAPPQAARLSKAVLFAGGTIPVTVRFSDATGVPNLPDGSDLANPHGMAIKFHLPDGSETDMVLCSIKYFHQILSGFQRRGFP